MSQINVDDILPQSGSDVNVNGVVIKEINANNRFILYGGTAFTPNTSTGNNITIVGSRAMPVNTGNSNTAIGSNALRNNLTGSNNTSLGKDALFNNTTGSSNSALGEAALYAITTGSNNVAIGQQALYQNNGTENVCIGNSAGFITTGSYNVIIGTSSGATLTTGSNNVLLGDDTQTATATTNNSITLGNASHNVLRCAVTTITSLSDARDKKEIEELPVGLEFVEKLKPVKFTWDDRNEEGKHDVEDFGFIAQDLKASQEEANASYLGLVYEENPEKLEASYGKLLPVLVKAIQELSSEVKSLKEELEALKNK